MEGINIPLVIFSWLVALVSAGLLYSALKKG